MPRVSLRFVLAAALLLASATFASAACTGAPAPPQHTPQPLSLDASTRDVESDVVISDDADDLDARDAAPDAIDDAVVVSDDPFMLHLETREALLELVADPNDPQALASFPFGPGIRQISQGNKRVAQHAIGRLTCLEGLRDLVLQAPEQRATCGGRDNMVPVFGKEAKGDPALAKFCIDVFEFPNKPCVLPLVWMSPTQADEICKADGKRLCDQDEWALACRGDPAGGKDRIYAYGNALDLTTCNTNKSRIGRKVPCAFTSMTDIWSTCTTDTEPTGAYPKCRSRFGVFDQHGNVAEIMTRKDPDGHTYSQLRGSAFHYTDVAKKHYEPGGYYLRYPDHCNFEPRWHVEKIEQAHHTNYHLGFRCCASVTANARP
jgi:sulfatase modifying factor 1